MIKWLKDNWKAIGIIALGIILPMLILNFAMDITLFDSLSSADNSAWLGFWGGYLGSIVSIGGIYWQVNRELRGAKELDLNSARALVLIKKKYENLTGNVYCTNAFENKNNIFGVQLPFFEIENISANLMSAVKIIIEYNDGTSEECSIKRIVGGEHFSIVTSYTEKALEMMRKRLKTVEESKKREENCKNLGLRQIAKVKIYYCTSKQEKMLVVFKTKGNLIYKDPYVKKYKDNNDELSYNLNNFSESKIIKYK